MAQWVKNPPAMQEMKADVSLIPGSRRSPEKGMTAHSSTLAWRIPRTDEPDGLQSVESHRARHNWCGWAHTHTSLLEIEILTGKYTWKRYSEMALGAWRHLLQSVAYHLMNVWKQVIFLQLSTTSPRKSTQKALSLPCEWKDNQPNTDSSGRTRDRKLLWISWVLLHHL